MAATSPYHRYNLRRNPFGELTRHERAELAVVELDGWMKFLQHDRAVLQFIGPCGHGKTTHLLALQQALGNADYVYLPEDGPQPPVGNHRPMIVDEAQRLSFWRLRRVLKAGGPLVFGTHNDLSTAIRRAGLLLVAPRRKRESRQDLPVASLRRGSESLSPLASFAERRATFEVVTIDVSADSSPEWLAEILNRRIESSRLSGGTIPLISVDQALRWQRQFGANVRAIEHFLYDQFQRCALEKTEWPPVS